MMDINLKRRLMLSGTVVLGAAAAAACAGGQVMARAPEVRVIKVVAKKFDFTPNTIHLKQGETVELELTTEDVVMGFNLPYLKVRADIIPGRVSRLRMTPDKAGKLDFFCDIFCGSGHEEMTGTIIVT
jgi:cytochrome c oxidase subunit 2